RRPRGSRTTPPRPESGSPVGSATAGPPSPPPPALGRSAMLPLAELYPPERLAVEVSLWSADLSALGAEAARLSPYADVFHIDASDTRFVPSPLFFPDLVAAL